MYLNAVGGEGTGIESERLSSWTLLVQLSLDVVVSSPQRDECGGLEA